MCDKLGLLQQSWSADATQGATLNLQAPTWEKVTSFAATPGENPLSTVYRHSWHTPVWCFKCGWVFVWRSTRTQKNQTENRLKKDDASTATPPKSNLMSRVAQPLAWNQRTCGEVKPWCGDAKIRRCLSGTRSEFVGACDSPLGGGGWFGRLVAA